jgi:hypothetical protein
MRARGNVCARRFSCPSLRESIPDEKAHDFEIGRHLTQRSAFTSPQPFENSNSASLERAQDNRMMIGYPQ